MCGRPAAAFNVALHMHETAGSGLSHLEIFLQLGAALIFTISVIMIMRFNHRRRIWLKAKATVKDYRIVGGIFYPILVIKSKDGEDRTVSFNSGYKIQVYAPGTSIDVYIHPADGNKVIIASFWYNNLSWIFLAAFAIGLIGVFGYHH